MKVKTDIRAGKGLGDAIADFTRATGLEAWAETYEELTGKECGCKRRRKMLNEAVPYVPLT